MPLIGVQQFQIRTVIQTQKQALETLSKMKAAGYDSIELCGFMIRKMPWTIRLLTRLAGMPMGNSGRLDWHQLIRDSGMKVVSLHEDLGTVSRTPETVAEKAKDFGTPYVVITGMHHFDYSDLQAVKQLASQLNDAGKRLHALGIQLLYHNHNCELRKVLDGKTAFEVLIEETDPAYLNFELDSYWLAEAGADPLLWMKRLGTRMKLYHINDRGSRVTGKKSSILKSDSMELGYGNMDLHALMTQAIENQVDGIVLETHRNWVEGSPVKSLELSGKFLIKHLL